MKIISFYFFSYKKTAIVIDGGFLIKKYRQEDVAPGVQKISSNALQFAAKVSALKATQLAQLRGISSHSLSSLHVLGGFYPTYLDYIFKLNLIQQIAFHELKGLLVAIPKTRFIDQLPPEGREDFMINQRNFINKALQDYGVPELPVIFNLHFGHVDPQMIIPNGSLVLIDGDQKKVIFQ